MVSNKPRNWVTIGAKDRIGAVRRFMGALFPERQLFYRSRGEVRFVTVSGAAQLALTAVFAAFIGWVGFASSYYFSFDWMIGVRERQRDAARRDYREVVREIGGYHRRFAGLTAGMEASRATLDRMIDRSGVVRRRDRSASGDGAALGAAFARPAPAHLTGMREDWRRLARRDRDLERGLAVMEGEVRDIVSAHGAVTNQRNRLRQKVAALQGTLTALRQSQEAVLRRVTRRTSDTVIAAEKLIAMTGLNVTRLLAALDRKDRVTMAQLPDGQGGPFLELAALRTPGDDVLDSRVAALDAQMGRWQRLQRLLRLLPLASPVDYYRLTSVFGRRIDPMRRRWSQHNGLDIANGFGTPILSPAPGRVVFAGRNGGFGRMVEIDHGLGIRTRYAHLQKILVKRGQVVEFRDKIAEMGSSGRSTGPHLHYEVRVNGRPVNPMKFLKAGKYVFKSK